MRALLFVTVLLSSGCILDRSGTRPDRQGADGSVDAATMDASVGSDASGCGEGETRPVACGGCGMQTERCTGGDWIAASDCVEVPVCTPDDVETETEPCGLCGGRQRTRTCLGCDGWGAWSDFGECTGEGVCTPGATQTRMEGCGSCGGMRSVTEICNGSCAWEQSSAGACVEVTCDIPVFGGSRCPGETATFPCPSSIGLQRCRCNSSGEWEACESFSC